MILWYNLVLDMIKNEGREMAKSKIVNIKSAKKRNRKQGKDNTPKKKQERVRVPLTPKERKKELRRKMITLIIVIIFIIAGGYSVYKIGVLQMDRHQLNDENMDLKREKELLEEELKNVQDLEYVEEEAREKLNLILPGEVIYRFSDDKKGK